MCADGHQLKLKSVHCTKGAALARALMPSTALCKQRMIQEQCTVPQGVAKRSRSALHERFVRCQRPHVLCTVLLHAYIICIIFITFRLRQRTTFERC
jgi:hypothetical protein